MRFERLCVALIASSLLILPGCQTTSGTTPDGNNENAKLFTTLIGAGLGALAGSRIGSGRGQIVAAVIGAAIGGYLANTIFANMTKNDQQTHLKTRDTALREVPDGQTLSWNNPDSSAGANITPLSTYKNDVGTACREVEEKIVVDGKEEIIRSSHCWDDGKQRFNVVTS